LLLVERFTPSRSQAFINGRLFRHFAQTRDVAWGSNDASGNGIANRRSDTEPHAQHLKKAARSGAGQLPQWKMRQK
jgi:hypothetical protein